MKNNIQILKPTELSSKIKNVALQKYQDNSHEELVKIINTQAKIILNNSCTINTQAKALQIGSEVAKITAEALFNFAIASRKNIDTIKTQADIIDKLLAKLSEKRLLAE